MPTLPRTTRLRRSADFSRAFANGRSVRSGQIAIRYLRRDPDAFRPVRTGFVVSRRHVRTAVRRNRIRRLLRESYRLVRHEFESRLPSGIFADLVLVWNGDGDQALRPNFALISRNIESVLKSVAEKLSSGS